MCAYACVCHHHSPVDSFLWVYESICMLAPLNDCDYIRQYFTVNYKVLCIKNGIVFPHIYIMQPWSYVRTNTHTSRGASFIALSWALHDTHTHTHTISYELEICLMMTHTSHTHTHVWLCCKTHISLPHLQKRFSFTHAVLHATGVLIASVCDESS